MNKYLLVLLSISCSAFSHDNCNERDDGFAYCEAPHPRLLEYGGSLIEAGQYGERDGYIGALDCIFKSIHSGDLMGKKWNSTYMRSSFVDVPKDIAATRIDLTPEYMTYLIALGDSEYVYSVSLTEDGSCTIENERFIDV